MKNLKNEKLVFNNALLSNFARIKKLELIFYLSEWLYTTQEVVEEIKEGVNQKPALNHIIECIKQKKIKIVSVKEESNILLMDRLIRKRILGMGEISAMVSAKELNGIFITDDEVATKKAINLQIRILDYNEYRDTVSFLKILRYKKIISDGEYRDIKTLLGEKFHFLINKLPHRKRWGSKNFNKVDNLKEISYAIYTISLGPEFLARINPIQNF